MDRITLEHYEERAKKARQIVEKIDSLLKYLERVDNTATIQFSDQNTNNLFELSSRYSDSSRNHKRLIDMIKPALVLLITEEIALLESELAAL